MPRVAQNEGGLTFVCMKKRTSFIPLLVLVLVFVAFLIRRWNEPKAKEVFDRHPSMLVYTKHALCRMDCRHISKSEINEIIEHGIINLSKSDKAGRPCPIFAMQGRTSGGENLRVICAQCQAETKVITCYNLEEEFSCNCPGDENKKSH